MGSARSWSRTEAETVNGPATPRRLTARRNGSYHLPPPPTTRRVRMAAATEIDSLATVIAAAEGAGLPGPEFPSLDDALARLADIPADQRLALARRLALEDLVRAQPDFAAEGPRRDLAGRALGPGGTLGLDPGRLLFDDSARLRSTGRLRRVLTDEGVAAVAVVGTKVTLRGPSFAEAKRVLNPMNWFQCYGKWWTGMTLQADGQDRRHYREVVAGWSPSLKVDVCLQFVRSNEPGELATLEFERCRVEEHQPPDLRVDVDEGWVEVERWGTRCRSRRASGSGSPIRSTTGRSCRSPRSGSVTGTSPTSS